MSFKLVDETFSDVVRDTTYTMAESMVSKTDELLREAITRFLGTKDWALESLSGRCHLFKLANGVEIFSLDGVDLLELHPVIVETEIDRDSATQINASRKYRFLI